MSAKPPPPAGRRRSWVWRLLRTLTGMALSALVISTVVVWWAWRHPASVVRMVLERVEGPFVPSVEDVVLEPDGTLVLKRLQVRETQTGKVALLADTLSWRFDLSSALAGQYGKVAVSGVQLDLDADQAGQLRKLMGSPAPGRSSPAAAALERLDVKSVHIRVAETPELPAIEFTLDHLSEGVDLGNAAHPAVKRFQFILTDLKVAGNSVPHAHVDGALSAEGDLRIDQLTVTGGRIVPTAALLRFLNQPSPAVAPPAVTGPAVIKSVHVGQIKLDDFALASGDAGVRLPRWWPLIRGRASCTLSQLAVDETGQVSLGSQQVELHDVELHSSKDQGRLALPQAKISVAGTSEGGVLHVLEASLNQPAIEWTQGLEDDLFPGTAAAAQAPSAAGVGAAVSWGVYLESLSMDGARVAVSRTRRVGYQGQAKLDLHLDAVHVDGKGLTSSHAQSLRVSDLVLAEHPADREQALEPFAELEEGSLVLVPDEFLQHSAVSELMLKKPVVRGRRELVSWFNTKPASPPASAPPNADAGPSWASKLHFRELTISDGSVEYANDHGQQVELRARLAVSTEGNVHRLKLEKLQGMLPQHATLPVAGIELIEATLQMPELWQTKRIGSLSIVGGEVDVGDALMSLTQSSSADTFEGPPAPVSAPAPVPAFTPSTGGASGWRINGLTIKDTAVTLQRVAPGLPPVKFEINYHAAELPLSPAELSGNMEAQQVELSQLAIKSPYEPLRNVAYLPTLFVSFTLDGLFKQRIDKVQIISPTLFVGEDLFWYVDYYRKYAAGEPLPGMPEARMVSVNRMMALEAAVSAAEAPVKEVGTWNVDTLEVNAGKLVIAPKGRPLPGIPRPFPFSFTTKLNQGKMEAQFDIPPDTYTWEQLKIELQGMRGRVLFNLPVQTVDNNLTETFSVDRIRYKQLHLEKAHLTVTYDANGIYGKFGGEAYEGYVNGAFNVYNDTSYSWDGWISGTNVKTTEITQKVCPAYLLLDGKVDGTIVAQGNMKEVYQCDIKFQNSTPGKFSIVALNDMLTALGAEAPAYQQDMVKIGVEMLRDLDYEHVHGQARFYGREGKGFLHIVGPAGTRKIDVNIFDHRWPAPSPPKIQVSSQGTP